MGTWGSGIYSGDFAADLRATIGAVARLPFEAPRLVEILRQSNAETLSSPDSADYATFWLVTADQLHRRGIDSSDVFGRAVEIIDSGKDLRALAELGMEAPDLRKREKKLRELRAKLIGPLPSKARKTLRTPQPLLMETGDLVVYPCSADGDSVNPYLTDADGAADWSQGGWGAAVIVDSGRAYDFLAWYLPIVLVEVLSRRPSAERLLSRRLVWGHRLAGTCSRTHFKRLRLEKVTRLSIDPKRLGEVFPEPGLRTSAAISDISISNRLSSKGRRHETSTIHGLETITTDRRRSRLGRLFRPSNRDG